MANNVEIVDNLVSVQFATQVTPVFLEKKNKDYILYGADNNYPSFVLSLYKDHPEHGAIVKAKSKYLYGKGLKINNEGNTVEVAKAANFLYNANRYNDWNYVYDRTTKSFEIFNGFAWQIIWNAGGTGFEVYPLLFSKVRKGKDKSTFYYCDAWTKEDGTPNSYPEKHPSFRSYPAFNTNVRTGTQIYYYAEFDEAAEVHGETYPLPEYAQANINIATDVAISEFQHALATQGFTAQGMLSLFNGQPTEEGKRKLEKLFNDKFTGARKAGRIIFNFVDPDNAAKGAEYLNLATSDLDKQFELISKTNQQKIITGHQVTNKQLFGISSEGALSDRTTLDISFRQLQNTYTVPRQNKILAEIKYLGSVVNVNLDSLEVDQLTPIDVDFLDPNVAKYLTEDEIRSKLGLKPKSESVQSQPVQQSQVNEHLKNLTGRQWQGINRIKRNYQSGKISRQEAEMMLKNGFGLGVEDIGIMLGFSSDIDPILAKFEALAEDDNEDEIVNEEFVEFKGNAANSYEFITHQSFVSASETRNKVLSILQGEPTASEDKIAKQLGIDKQDVAEAMKELQIRGLITKTNIGVQVTEEGINKTVKPVEVEVYTVYKYVTRPNVPRAQQTRPFCERLLSLTDSGKVWTRDAVDSISNEFKQDAWIYRGGWYTNPNTGETTPYCRHIWKAVTKTRVKK